MLIYRDASYLRQLLVGLVDASLSVALVTIVIITKKPEVLYQYLAFINPSLLVLLLFSMYRLVCFLFFKQTLGMRLFHVILLNGEEQPLTYTEKSLAAIFILYQGTGYYQTK